MFKKIFTFFILFIFIFIGFLHNSMMAFAMHHGNMSMSHVVLKKVKINKFNKTSKQANNYHNNCNKQVIFDNIKFFSNQNIPNINIGYSYLCIKKLIFPINNFYSYIGYIKKIIKITSPPILERNIKYYSYGDLVKIIKSNT